MNDITSQTYDPTWIVNLATKQIPEQKEIIEALKKCTSVVKLCNCGCGDVYFIDPESKQWNFDYNVILEREDEVEVILDVMKDKSIGSIEIGEWDKKN